MCFLWLYVSALIVGSFCNAHVVIRPSNSEIADNHGVESTHIATTIEAGQISASASWKLNQVASTPAVPIPTDISNISKYTIVKQLARAMPPIHDAVDFSDSTDMVADFTSSTDRSNTGQFPVGDQSTLRVMIVGDSMTQGQQGDWTWRYRIWQWFQQNHIAVHFVGPYEGTLPPKPAAAPSTPPLHGHSPRQSPQAMNGGYAKDVDAAFLSNSNHFAAWGRAAAITKGVIGDVVRQHQPDLMLLILGFNDLGWFLSDGQGAIDNTETLISNARAANPNLKFAVADIPQRRFMDGREDLVDNTNKFNVLIPDAVSDWSTMQSPVHLVKLQRDYHCGPDSCPAGERYPSGTFPFSIC
jgi:lysophospholipase L1-like esterase